MPFGSELAFTPGLSRFEQLYIRLFGAPILGMRVRARAILPRLGEIVRPRRIADAGCGRGLITLACARAFPHAEVIGLDLNEQQNQINAIIARRIGIRNVEFQSWDVLKLDELGGFDVILSSDNLEHLDDDLECARTFYRALNPGGFLIVHVPHLTRNLFGWHRPNWMSIEGHVRPGYTRDSLTSLLAHGGFQNIRVVYNYNSIETLANDLSFLITGGHERRRRLYALCFPLLMGLASLGALYRPTTDGTGLIALACKPNGDAAPTRAAMHDD
jgi:SAM-dependent methyltransferase